MRIQNLRRKLALLFLFVMATASMLSLLVSAALSSRSLKDEIVDGQAAMAVTMLELYNKTDLSIDEIMSISSIGSYYSAKVHDEASGKPGAEELEGLKQSRNKTLFVRKGLLPIGDTFFYMGDQLMKISMRTEMGSIWTYLLRTTLTLVFCVVIGTLIIAATGKRVLRRIQKLNEATKRVAQGDFDVKLDKQGDDEIGELTESFNKMVQELKGIELLRHDFINHVSHEFKTPIASIQGFAKLLQAASLPEDERREYSDIIVSEMERLSKLSSNILKLSKLENQGIVVEQREFSLDEQIRRTILMLEPEWSRKNIDFHVELEDIRFRGSEELLQQVWLNLLDNAVKFTGIGGRVTVKLYRTNTSIKTRIIDTGPGMDEAVMERIFEKFYQGDSARSQEGNGLGLPLVKRIVELCKGKIYVKSQKGKGSAFIVELPWRE